MPRHHREQGDDTADVEHQERQAGEAQDFHRSLSAHAASLFDREHADAYVALIAAIMGALVQSGVIKPPPRT